MKAFFFSISVLAMSLSFSACTKCQVCEAKDQDNVVRHTYDEVCGKSKDLEVNAQKCATEYGGYDGFSCSCTEVN